MPKQKVSSWGKATALAGCRNKRYPPEAKPPLWRDAETKGILLNEHWPAIREQLLKGSYQPKPVLRVEVEKPEGGMRKLGIPTVVDRFIQQAVMQVLQNRWDVTFSDSSYGFRPGRSAHQAVARAQQYIAEGSTYVVDLDLEKFFD